MACHILERKNKGRVTQLSRGSGWGERRPSYKLTLEAREEWRRVRLNGLWSPERRARK